MSSACCTVDLQLFNFLNFLIKVTSEIKMMMKISANMVFYECDGRSVIIRECDTLDHRSS